MSEKIKVGLFATCLVDLFRPSVGYAAVKLLRQAGCEVYVPRAQTCCGQPAYNSGDRKHAVEIARQVITVFEPFDYVVLPSGSCAGTMAKHYPELFADDANWSKRAQEFAAKVHELVSFLVEIAGMERVDAAYDGSATYHDSCSGLRELGVRDQPRQLLATVRGLNLTEMKGSDICCGFGGTFAVKYAEISDKIVTEKTASIEATESDLLLAGDLGCLMNMAGKLKRQGSKTQARHVAEVLAGMVDTPAIAEDKNG